jgi:hypothetical protein
VGSGKRLNEGKVIAQDLRSKPASRLSLMRCVLRPALHWGRGDGASFVGLDRWLLSSHSLTEELLAFLNMLSECLES